MTHECQDQDKEDREHLKLSKLSLKNSEAAL